VALSNRDRIGRAFELLAAGLGPYVDRRMRAASRAGQEWLAAWASSARPPLRGEVSLSDPALQLRVMVESWDAAFRDELRRADRNLVFELRDVRNRWAHNDAFTVDDTYRGLDSIERLLTAIDASEAAEVGRGKEELMRARYEAQARRAMPRADALLTEPAAGLRPWREVIQPHDDVARGRFALAEFAADLHLVSLGEGADEYADPLAFFQRTFLTAGLRQLLSDAVQRLSGAGGAPVVDLQTTFGGGKTHSMIALHHLFSGLPLDTFPQEVQDLVRATGAPTIPRARRAVLVGTRIPPGQPVAKPDGTEVGTLWGELAWQLDGPAGFALVAEADRSGTNPGDALRTLLRRCAPCLVLIDEWVAYARELYADDTLRAGTFDSHFSFAQALTETVRATEGALLVVSLPASGGSHGSAVGSDLEVGGVGGREALRRLRAVVGRMESSWRPATSEESFEIVRRRLFQPVEASRLADRDATARVFGDLYRQQASEFPTECRDQAYVERMKQAYPVHPELFARLYEDWSTLDRFQRTRGVLRLMATVVHALWAAGDQAPVILPASVPLSDTAVAAELTRNLDDAWKPIIDVDVDGPGSLPRALDDQYRNLGRYLAARRVARTVFLASAPRAGSPNQGVDAARVRLGCALPGETVAIYADALSRLADRASHFYVGGGRYWYGIQPSVARLARDRTERLMAGGRHEVHDEIIKRLRRYERDRGAFFAGVHAVPGGPADVADVAEARLVLLGPAQPHVPRSSDSQALEQAQVILDSRGPAPRDYRNMLVFLAADQRRVADLEQAAAEHIAWSSIVEESDALVLDPLQSGQARNRRDDADRTVDLRMSDAYQWVLVPRQPEPTRPIEWEAVKVDGEGGLTERAGRKLVHGGALYVSYPAVLLRLQLDGPLAPLWEAGHTTVNEVWDAYARYLYLHRLRSIETLSAAVASAPGSTVWDTEGLAVAEGHDTGTGSYHGLVAGSVVPDARGTTLLVRPEVASEQLVAERRSRGEDDETDPEHPADGEAESGPPRLRRFYGVVSVDAERLGRDAGRIGQEVVAHLNGLVGTDIEVTVELRATNDDGFDDDIVRTVSENAAALRFRSHGFEQR
jgi:predicted AAA+ superfamily ATPase